MTTVKLQITKGDGIDIGNDIKVALAVNQVTRAVARAKPKKQVHKREKDKQKKKKKKPRRSYSMRKRWRK